MSMTTTLASKLTVAHDLSPDSRDRNYKGRIKQMFGVFSAHPLKTMGVSALGAIFFLPLLAVLVVILPYIIEPSILANYKFVGDLGMGYGATSAAYAAEALTKIYNARILYSLCIIPGLMIGSIGMAGAYNVMRNYLWDVDTHVFRDFFKGIARHWYKFLITFTVLGIIATGAVCSILEIVKYTSIQGSCPAIWWVLAVFACLLGLVAIMYCIVTVPMFVTYRFSDKPMQNFGICLKNGALLTLINSVQILIMAVIFVAPCLLFLINTIVWFVVVVLIVYGFAFYAVMNIAYSQFLTDNFIAYLYNKQVADELKAKAKANKEYKDKKQKTNNKKKRK